MDEDRVKEIVSKYIKTDVKRISNGTPVNKHVIRNSIMFQRMISEVKALGIEIKTANRIQTFGDLIKQNADTSTDIGNNDAILNRSMQQKQGVIIGVDIEIIQNFPKSDDYRTEPFYNNTFSQREISYCITQNEPLDSFAGKYAAKEALKKADSMIMNVPYNQIEVLNDSNGKPFYEGFTLSISHSGKYAVCVAVKNLETECDKIKDDLQSQNEIITNLLKTKKIYNYFIFIIIALLLIQTLIFLIFR